MQNLMTISEVLTEADRVGAKKIRHVNNGLYFIVGGYFCFTEEGNRMGENPTSLSDVKKLTEKKWSLVIEPREIFINECLGRLSCTIYSSKDKARAVPLPINYIRTLKFREVLEESCTGSE